MIYHYPNKHQKRKPISVTAITFSRQICSKSVWLQGVDPVSLRDSCQPARGRKPPFSIVGVSVLITPFRIRVRDVHTLLSGQVCSPSSQQSLRLHNTRRKPIIGNTPAPKQIPEKSGTEIALLISQRSSLNTSALLISAGLAALAVLRFDLLPFFMDLVFF